MRNIKIFFIGLPLASLMIYIILMSKGIALPFVLILWFAYLIKQAYKS